MTKGDNTRKRKTVYELVGESRPPFKRGVDPLDDILLDEERELSRELKRIRLEQIVMKRRREIARMKAGGDPDLGPMASNADFMKVARLMTDLSPEEQQRVASAYAALRLADKGQFGGSLGLLGPLLGYARQNPGASEAQMVQYLTLMNNQFSKGLEIAKASNPKQDGSVELLKIFSDLVKDSVKKPMEDLAKNLQPQPSAFEQIIMNPEMRSAAKEMGMFGGREITKGGSTEMDLKIAEITTANTLEMKKMDLEWRKSMLERQAEDRKTENLLAVFAPLATAFAGPVSQKMQALGHQQAAFYNPVQHNPTPKIPPGTTVNIQCSCGYVGTAPLTDPPQSELVCPECNQVLVANIPSSPTEETTVDMSKGHLTGEI